MADLITTKAAFPKSGGLAVANGAVSVNAGNGLHVNPTTGMVEVPVDTTAGLGYGSNGLEVEVDGSTIDFNSSGQLTALGGGGSEINFFTTDWVNSSAPASVGDFTFTFPYLVSANSSPVYSGLYSNKWIYLNNFYARSDANSVLTLLNIAHPNAINFTVNDVLVSSTTSTEIGYATYWSSSSNAWMPITIKGSYNPKYHRLDIAAEDNVSTKYVLFNLIIKANLSN